MKLRTKLTISFLTIILAPILLIGASVTVMNHFQIKALREIYGLADTEILFSSNTLQLFNALTQSMRDEVERIMQDDTAALEDAEYLENLNQRLMEKHSYLIVRKNGDILFTGDVAGQRIYDRLPGYGYGSNIKNQEGIYLGGEVGCLMSQQDFLFADGGEGSLFIVTNVEPLLPEVRSVVMEIVYVIILVLILTAVLLTVWLYGSILRPLGALKKATREIKNGNLDFSIDVSGKDEISELCMGFEEMRLRLKENSEEKMQYDADNKVLISNISHDLKTPITAIKGYVEGILDGVASSPEKLDKYVRTIYNKANDMDKLIDELTLYSKIDTNRIPYNFSKIKIDDYFNDCVEELKLELSAKNIELTYYNYLTEDVTIIGDTEQLKRVINNIISNSVKYMDKKKGLINIRIRDSGDFVQIEIEDNGRGISGRDLPYIFDRFYRADASRNSSTGGSGIGLSIVRKIIEDHGGRIWATSKESTGTIMHFVLRKYQETPIQG
ncbi:ATP-binding protein [Hominifimenecus sp. rT4P-3]|uniref:sensor histidine kinase n=1 Tax=Hominifimenecus sp. rT4P-3 TaxID=3242979 RepID=UPI003DA2F3C3